MASGSESLYNYNNYSYSATGDPFYPSSYLKLKMNYSSTTDVANNQSTITATVKLYHAEIEVGGFNIKLFWNDTEVASFSGAGVWDYSTSTATLGSKSFKVTHGNDGTASGVLRAEWYPILNYSGLYIYEMGCKTSTITLDTIPRATTFTLGSSSVVVNGSNKVQIKAKAASSSFTHKYSIKINSSYASDVISVPGGSTSYTWEYAVPKTWIAGIASGGTSATVKVETYSGNTKIGESSTTVTLKHPSASTFTLSSTTVSINASNAVSITISPSVANTFMHVMKITLGNKSYTTNPAIAAGTNTASYAIPSDWLEEFTTSSSKAGTVTLTTYYGSTSKQIGSVQSKSVTFTSGLSPTIGTQVYTETGPISSSFKSDNPGVYLSNRSNIEVELPVTQRNGSDIASATLTCTIDGTTTTISPKSSTLSSGVRKFKFNIIPVTSGTLQITSSATDKRGKTVTKKLTSLTISYYVTPAISSVLTKRANSGGTASDTGTYASCKVTFTARTTITGGSSNNNPVTVKIVGSNGSSSTTSSATSPLTKTLGTSSYPFATDTAYTVTYTVTDKVGASVSRTDTLSAAFIPMDFYPGKNGGVGIGQLATAGNFDVNLPTKLHKDVVADGNITADTYDTYWQNIILVNDGTSYRKRVIALCEVAETDSTSVVWGTSGRISFHRINGTVPIYRLDYTAMNQYATANKFLYSHFTNLPYSTSWTKNGTSNGYRPCTFKYNGKLYGGIAYKITDGNGNYVLYNGTGSFTPFAVEYYDTNNASTLNSEIYNSINFDNVVWSGSNYYGDVAYASSAGSATTATKATQDGNGANIASTYLKTSGLAAQLLNLVYPVGSVYMSTTNTSPQTFLGGTWTKIEGKWLVAAGTSTNGKSYTAGTSYAQELPNIKGSFDNTDVARYNFGRSGYTDVSGALSGSKTRSGWDGSYGPESDSYACLNFDASKSSSVYKDSGVVQPASYAVYMWRRTA